MKCLREGCRKSSSLLFPVNLATSLPPWGVLAELWGVTATETWSWQTHLQGRNVLVTELLQSRWWWGGAGGSEQTEMLISNAMINLRYEIVGTELPCPEAVRYCFILLVSYYQQSQSAPTAPRAQSPFYITFIRRCTNVENIWRQPSELCFLQGLRGPLPKEGTSSWSLVHLLTGLDSSDTVRAAHILLHHSRTSSYRSDFKPMFMFKTLSKTDCV